jgi:hypothetical protein
MTLIKGRTFEEQEVVVDYIHFDDCTFTNCTLIFNGHGLPRFTQCEWNDCSVVMQESASKTLNFLRTFGETSIGHVVVEIASELIGGATTRLVEIDGTVHLVLDSGPVEDEILDQVKEAFRAREEDGGVAEAVDVTPKVSHEDSNDSDPDENDHT